MSEIMYAKNKYKLTKKYIIKTKDEFQKAFKEGKRLFGLFYVVIYTKSKLPYPRVGITVSKKVGKAPKRNYEKRLIREFFRHCFHFLNNFDIIIIKNKKEGAFKNKEEDFRKLMKKLSRSKY